MIELNQVSLMRGIQPLLDKTNLRIHDGQKIALIGANGAGKSSMFAMLLSELAIDHGDLHIPPNLRIAHMKQEVSATDRSALDYVIDGDTQFRHIEQQLATVTDDHQLAHWHGQMDLHNGYDVKNKAEKLLHGLGFKTPDHQNTVKSFSGGWRIRLNLAQALMMPSDLMLLDEPTNHLDLDATLWLEQWLNKYTGTLLFISHDRDFIDGVADHIVHLYQQQLVQYPGNYSAYECIRAERLAQQQTLFEKQQTRVAEIEKFVTRFKAKASKAKQAQSRVKELERMELIAPAHVDSPFNFEFPCYEKVSNPLLHIDQAEMGYQQSVILNQVKASIVPGHRIGLLGPNGAGKSTLIKTLCNDLPLLSGERSTGEHLRVGYYAQHQLESLDLQASPVLMIQRLSSDVTEQQARNFLGGFDFRGDKALEACAPFSGGEKARLALALVAWQQPNLLILDEPTNHLDIEMREALTMALQSYPGAIVVVSHDRHLLKATVDEYWLVDQGQVQPFDGDLEDYHQYIQQQQKVDKSEPDDQASSKSNSRENRKEAKRLDAERRKKLAPLSKQLKKIEGSMEKLQKQLSQIEEQMADTSIYEDSRKADLQVLLQQQGDATSQLEEQEMMWMELSEEIESFE